MHGKQDNVFGGSTAINIRDESKEGYCINIPKHSHVSLSPNPPSTGE
jgi:hypothetical protein